MLMSTDRKQSPLTCPQCDFTADQRAALSRHLRTHSRHESPNSSPEVNDDDDDDVDVESEDVASAPSAADDLRDLFCADCRIQFTSPGTYRAHRSYYCKRRARRDADDAPGGGVEDAAVRRRRRGSDGGSGVAERPHARSDDLRPFKDVCPALFPPTLAALSSPAGLMEMLGAPPPPPPGAFFLAPFLAAAAAAAAAGLPANGLTGSVAAVQQSPPSSRPLQPPSAGRRSSTSVSDDEPLDLSTCRNVAVDDKIAKHDSVSPAAAATAASAVSYPRQFAADTVVDTSSLFLPPPARLPLAANLPLPVVRPPLSSPPSISHCAECNIVFYKHANYLAHKAHYCAGRHAAPVTGSQDQAAGLPAPPAGKSAPMLKSDDVVRGSVMPDEGRRRSPEPHELVATLDDTGTTIQFYCIPCKIKFSSLDTLRAHKQFYCPARFEAPPSIVGSSGEPATSGRHRHTSRVYSGAEDGERQAGDAAAAGSTCTACGAKVSSPRSAHRCPAAASLYQCPHCDYAAQSDSRLVEHVRAHAPSRAFRCALCGYRGNTVRGMRMHGKMHNDEAAAAAAGRAGSSSVQLPTFTDDCVIEYEEPPAIPPRRGAGTAASARPGVDTELLRQKNEPYKRRRSRKAYEKAEYAPAAPSTPVVCAECSAPLLDTTHAQAHASAHAAERLLAWEALYGAAAMPPNTPAAAAVPVCKEDVDVDQRQSTSPEMSTKSAAHSLLSSVKVEQSESIDNVDVEVNRKCNGTDTTTADEHGSADRKSSAASPSDDVDVTGCPTARAHADDEEARSSTATATVCPDGRRSPPPLTDVATPPARPGRPAATAAVAHPAAAGAARRCPSVDVASRYCEQCDITFMYASTFIAHKKYYCSSHAAERTEATARASAATGVAV